MRTVDVVFASETATSGCQCDACRSIGEVIKLRLPTTHYYDRKELSTRYHNYWLCPICRDRLMYALDWQEEED